MEDHVYVKLHFLSYSFPVERNEEVHETTREGVSLPSPNLGPFVNKTK